MSSSSLRITDKCIYYGRVPLDNTVCNNCIDFLEACVPIITSSNGYSASSECDRYMCEGCNCKNCIFKD